MVKRGKIMPRVFAYFFIFVLAMSLFSTGVIAPSHPVFVGDDGGTDDVLGDVSTIIISNGGDISSIDAAIARAISEETGYPIVYVEHDDVTYVINELKNGLYLNVQNVVVLGGDVVVSNDAEELLETSSAVSGRDYEVTRISGTTATGTAVEAINYFYGPGMTSEVTLVAYNGDDNREYDEVLHMAAQSEGLIIPVTTDVEGLPAEVVELIDNNGIDNVNLVGDFERESEIKRDIEGSGANIAGEIDGDVRELEEKLQGQVLASVEVGDNIIFVEEGETPPVLPNHVVVYYRDENNDGVDDESGKELDDMALEIHQELLDNNGVNVGEFKVIGDNENVVADIEAGLETGGVSVEAAVYESPEDSVRAVIALHGSEQEAVDGHFEEGGRDFDERYENYKAQFEKALPELLEQFKAFYVIERDTFSEEELKLGAEILDEANKGDAVAQWKLIHALASEHKYGNYVEECSGDAGCVREQVELDKADIDEKLDILIGTERAREVANLEVGEKVGLLETTMFVPPGQEDEFRAKIDAIISEGGNAEDLHSLYIKNGNEEAYQKYTDELKEELGALGKYEEAAGLTLEEVRAKFDERLGLDAKAYLAGVVSPEEFRDPARRAEIIAKMESLHNDFATEGITDSYYLTPDDWKNAYEKYSQEGKLDRIDFDKYEVAVRAYTAWENDNPGTHDDPSGAYWDEKTGQFSCKDPEGKVVTGFYDDKSKAFTYTNEKGELVQWGDNTGYSKYSEDYGGWEKSTGTDGKWDGSWTGPKGERYIPPSTYNAVTGTYDYHHPSGEYPEGYVYSCGSNGCEGAIYTGPGSTWTPPHGWTHNADGSWADSEGHTYAGTTSYYSSGPSGTTTDVSGNTWTQSADGSWTSSGGATYSGHAGSYSYTAPSGSTEGGTSGGTFTAPSGGYTSTGSGGTTSTTSGGTTTTDSGGHTAPSGGDGGGGMTGYVIYDSEATRGLLAKWLFGR